MRAEAAERRRIERDLAITQKSVCALSIEEFPISMYKISRRRRLPARSVRRSSLPSVVPSARATRSRQPSPPLRRADESPASSELLSDSVFLPQESETRGSEENGLVDADR